MSRFLETLMIALNVLAFILMGLDKRNARAHKGRVPEKIFLAMAFVGGSAGVWLGMQIFRHKTKHTLFIVMIPLMVAVQVLALLYFTLRPS